MKKIATIILVLLVAPAMVLMAQNATPDKKTDQPVEKLAVGPKASWDVTVLDLGDINFMVPKDAEFTLTNSGNEPLLITYAKASCGCTNLKYSQEPVLPGKTTKMSVTYNGSGSGKFMKTITVQTNADDNPTTLQITGNVIKKE
jgi:hypothetical protein